MMMKRLSFPLGVLVTSIFFVQCSSGSGGGTPPAPQEETLDIPPPLQSELDPALVAEGQETFRFETFGDEAFWSGVLELDSAIAGADNGGFGPGLSPNTALQLGLKVDAEALPQSLVAAIGAGEVDLEDPATTLALLQLDAVLGVRGNFDGDGSLSSVGLTCALCHSTVDDSFAPGIGTRLDGWPNRDINVGAVVASANIEPLASLLGVDVETADTVLMGWGPGRFDGALLLDGRPTTPDGALIPAALIPALFGLTGIDPVSYTGYGDLELWGRFVAVVELGGQGNFSDPRLKDPERFPIAVQTGAFEITVEEDLVDPVWPGLEQYILSLLPPEPPAETLDVASAIRGQDIFEGAAGCASCHPAPLFADNVLHTPEEIGIDGIEANRFPSGMYRTTPLRGLFTKSVGGYFHDGRFEGLGDVITHYDTHFELGLTDAEKADLEAFLEAL